MMTSECDGTAVSEQTHQLRPLALAQKLLLGAIVALFVIRIGTVMMYGFVPPSLAYDLYVAGYVVTLILLLTAVVHLARTCGYSLIRRVLLAIAMIVPLINLITVLVVNAQATRRLREAGVKIGFTGADLSRL